MKLIMELKGCNLSGKKEPDLAIPDIRISEMNSIDILKKSLKRI